MNGLAMRLATVAIHTEDHRLVSRVLDIAKVGLPRLLQCVTSPLGLQPSAVVPSWFYSQYHEFFTPKPGYHNLGIDTIKSIFSDFVQRFNSFGVECSLG